MGSGAKSYIRKGFLIYCMRKKNAQIFPHTRPLVIDDFAPDPLISLYMRKIVLFYFLSVCCKEGN